MNHMNPSPPPGFIEVDRPAFFAGIGHLNVHPYPEGKYPYTSFFKTPEGLVRAVIVEEMVRGVERHQYFLPKGSP